jgi:phosphatidate cytidylyltransferase
MSLGEAIRSPYFWIYSAAAAVLLVATWVALFLLERRGRWLEEYRGVFWSWLWFCATAVLAVLLGHEAFVLAVALVSVLACKEFARATGLYQDWLFTGLVYLAILAVNGIALWAGLPGGAADSWAASGYDVFMATPIYAVAGLCLVPVFRNRSEGMLQRVALAVMAFVYFGYFLAHLSLLAGARVSVVYGYVFFLLFGTGTAALAGWWVGRQWGRHPLAPRISTAVTWESTGASFLWALVWSFVLGWTLPRPEFPWPAMLLSAVLFGILGPLGELVMRYILRDLGLRPPEGTAAVVPYLTLNHVNRLIFVAPLFFRMVHWFYPGVLASSR